MHTAPTLARSLGHIGSSALSQSLKSKIEELKITSIGVNPKQGLNPRDVVGGAASTIADRLWCHVQRTQSANTTPGSVGTLCHPGYQVTPVDKGEDILEEYRELSTNFQCETTSRIHDIQPSTTQYQNGKSACTSSMSVDDISAMSDDRILNGEAADRDSLLNGIRTARDSTTNAQGDTLPRPLADDEYLLFTF